MSGIINPSGVLSPDRNRGNHTNANPSTITLGPNAITDGVLARACTVTFVMKSPIGIAARMPRVHFIRPAPVCSVTVGAEVWGPS